MGTISRIFGSRKALFTLIAMAVATAMAWTARITGSEAMDFMKWVLGAWIFAQAAEDSIKHWKGTHPGTQKAEPAPLLEGDRPTMNPAETDSEPPPSR